MHESSCVRGFIACISQASAGCTNYRGQCLLHAAVTSRSSVLRRSGTCVMPQRAARLVLLVIAGCVASYIRFCLYGICRWIDQPASSAVRRSRESPCEGIRRPRRAISVGHDCVPANLSEGVRLWRRIRQSLRPIRRNSGIAAAARTATVRWDESGEVVEGTERARQRLGHCLCQVWLVEPTAVPTLHRAGGGEQPDALRMRLHLEGR